MFESISWSQYFVFVAVLMLLYYIFIALVYYGRELNSLINRRRSPSPLQQTNPAQGAPVMGSIRETHQSPRPGQIAGKDYTYDPNAIRQSVPKAENLMEDVGFMMDSIRAMLEQTGTKTSRAELMEKIPREMMSYAAIADLRSFEFLINQFIIKQTAVICKIELDESDLSAIWKKVNTQNQSA